MDLSYNAALMLRRLQQQYPNSEFTTKDMKRSCAGYMDESSKFNAINELLDSIMIKQTGSEYSEKTKDKVCDWFCLSDAGKMFKIRIGK